MNAENLFKNIIYQKNLQKKIHFSKYMIFGEFVFVFPHPLQVQKIVLFILFTLPYFLCCFLMNFSSISVVKFWFLKTYLPPSSDPSLTYLPSNNHEKTNIWCILSGKREVLDSITRLFYGKFSSIYQSKRHNFSKNSWILNGKREVWNSTSRLFFWKICSPIFYTTNTIWNIINL